MLANQTIDKLEALGLHAMAAGLSEQLSAPGTYDELAFADRLGPAGRQRGRRPRQPAPRRPAESSETALPGGRRGHRLPLAKRPRPLGDLGVWPRGDG